MIDASATPRSALEPAADSDRVRENWHAALPALPKRDDSDSGRLKDMLPDLLHALAEGGAGDSALHIREAIVDGRIDADRCSAFRWREIRRRSGRARSTWAFAGPGVADRRARHALASLAHRHRHVCRRPVVDVAIAVRRLGPRLLPVLRIVAGVHRSTRRRRARCAARSARRLGAAIAPLRLLRERRR